MAQAGEFAAWESAAAIIGGTRLPAVRQVIREDSARIWQFAKGSGERLTVENGLPTGNQKLRRAAIESHYRKTIEQLYA